MFSLSVLCLASNAFAVTGGNTEDGEAVAVPTTPTNTNIPVFTFQPSPSTSMLTDTTETAYNIVAWSSKNVGKDAGMIYHAVSESGGLWQHELDAVPTDAGTAGTTLSEYIQKE